MRQATEKIRVVVFKIRRNMETTRPSRGGQGYNERGAPTKLCHGYHSTTPGDNYSPSTTVPVEIAPVRRDELERDLNATFFFVFSKYIYHNTFSCIYHIYYSEFSGVSFILHFFLGHVSLGSLGTGV